MAAPGEPSGNSWFSKLRNKSKKPDLPDNNPDPSKSQNSPDPSKISQHKSNATLIRNLTEYTIVLREKNRLVWGDDQLVIQPNSSESYRVDNVRTFFQLGVVRRLQNREENTPIMIDGDELVENSEITFSVANDDKLSKNHTNRGSRRQ